MQHDINGNGNESKMRHVSYLQGVQNKRVKLPGFEIMTGNILRQTHHTITVMDWMSHRECKSTFGLLRRPFALSKRGLHPHKHPGLK
jgi:hypothetical protein